MTWANVVWFIRAYWFETAALAGIGALCGMKAVELWVRWRRDGRDY